MSHDLNGFKDIYLKEFNEILSDEDAERKARAVHNLYLAVYESVSGGVKEVS